MTRRGPKGTLWLLSPESNTGVSISAWAVLMQMRRGCTKHTAYAALRAIARGYKSRVFSLGREWITPHGQPLTRETVSTLRAEHGLPQIDDTIPRCLECGAPAICKGRIEGVREIWFTCTKHCTHAACLSLAESKTKHIENPYGDAQ